ncbi:IS256 family transposase ISDha1 [Vulcanimicrobium alpinum]|uniref:Mutator family transposase n=1 Tax=Vulcanimicrobium alpinum TaxID=3016050 RepID=A0AAN2CB27_UNVUL|nr:IS256 family transposase [Vulcanimicrobium alpinum]BDE07528.1 IS256 family transposase ISDha1 [Vulcanimicrobium alpinum]
MAKESVPPWALVDNLVAVVSEPQLADLRELLALVLDRAMQLEIEQRAGAGRYERSDERRTYRNGTRPRRFDTRLGTLDLAVPKLRFGGYVPAFLERRSRSERALVAVVHEAMLAGVSTRKMEKSFRTLGVESISKSQVSDLCAELDAKATAFRTRPLLKSYPYVMLDALYEKVRVEGAVISQAVIIAYGVSDDGLREVLGVDVVESESLESWTTFLRALLDRGLHGVKLVVSDAHAGLKAAIASVLTGASWQRCKVHLMRNVLAHVSQKNKAVVGADLSSIFAQPTRELAERRAADVVVTHRRTSARAMQVLEDGISDALSYLSFPRPHWHKLASTNPIEHLNRDIRRRTRLVGIFPTIASAIRLITLILAEQTEDWQTERRYMNSDLLTPFYG